MSDSTTSKMITLKSSNGEEFVVPETLAKQSQMIYHLIEDGPTMNLIPLPNVNTMIQAKEMEYCQKHTDAADVLKPDTTEEGSSTTPASSRISDEELRNWDNQSVDVDQRTLLIMAILKVADMIKGKSPEEIRQTFNIKNDYTPKEEEEIRCKFKWAFE